LSPGRGFSGIKLRFLGKHAQVYEVVIAVHRGRLELLQSFQALPEEFFLRRAVKGVDGDYENAAASAPPFANQGVALGLTRAQHLVRITIQHRISGSPNQDGLFGQFPDAVETYPPGARWGSRVDPEGLEGCRMCRGQNN
jgi:hypothetical protein